MVDDDMGDCKSEGRRTWIGGRGEGNGLGWRSRDEKERGMNFDLSLVAGERVKCGLGLNLGLVLGEN